MSKEEPMKEIDYDKEIDKFSTSDKACQNFSVMKLVNELRELNENLKNIDRHLEHIREGIARL